ncbi:MAG: glycerol-3-phosphate 1-O-acyltransferase PlsY [Clostridia bacterium]|nr:glycerol-3-phosphate 1-O-acyltransferase PlsY [Clostridia bacterium]MDH7572346.1 glycerol-3-phosphate 1-O-acyltransferase PlsY [Clostridia bacterium]
MSSYVLVLVACYLLGSIPVGYWTGRLKGVDVRQHGSGNIGMTNVIRVLGTAAGLAVLLGDVAKGAIAAWLGHAVGGPVLAALGGLAAVAGHNWSIFLGGRGGRGVATSAGAVLALAPWVAVSAVAVWAVTVLATRYVSVGSIVAGLSTPVFMLLYGQPAAYVLLGAAVAALIVLQHRPNLRRLRQGTEFRVGSGRSGR